MILFFLVIFVGNGNNKNIFGRHHSKKNLRKNFSSKENCFKMDFPKKKMVGRFFSWSQVWKTQKLLWKDHRPYSRRCTRCKSMGIGKQHTHIIFHHCKISATRCFSISFLKFCSKPENFIAKINQKKNGFYDRLTLLVAKKTKLLQCFKPMEDAMLYLEKQSIK